jgi:hypothetical protein
MRSLWTRIGLGAVGVFVVGMLLLTAAREAGSAVHAAISQTVANTLRGAAVAAAPRQLAFRLEGIELGQIRRLAVRREARGDLPDVKLEVDLADLSSLARLSRCDLVPDGNGDMAFEKGFRCATSRQRNLITVGEAVFTPSDLTRPVKVERSMEPDLRTGDPFEATAEMGGDVRILARGHDGAMVQVQADSGGAKIRVNDAMGRALVRLLADSQGASLRVRGKDGRDIVRLEAGGGGFSLTVDTSAAH